MRPLRGSSSMAGLRWSPTLGCARCSPLPPSPIHLHHAAVLMQTRPTRPPVCCSQVFAPAVKALRAANALAPIPVPSRTNASGPAATSQLPLLQALADFHLCRHCALIGALRPRRVLRRALTGSPVEQGKPLVCLKVRRTPFSVNTRRAPPRLVILAPVGAHHVR
eukprot:scaffold95998_cov27-Tisochrysis_lutea.AAC.4